MDPYYAQCEELFAQYPKNPARAMVHELLCFYKLAAKYEAFCETKVRSLLASGGFCAQTLSLDPDQGKACAEVCGPAGQSPEKTELLFNHGDELFGQNGFSCFAHFKNCAGQYRYMSHKCSCQKSNGKPCAHAMAALAACKEAIFDEAPGRIRACAAQAAISKAVPEPEAARAARAPKL